MTFLERKPELLVDPGWTRTYVRGFWDALLRGVDVTGELRRDVIGSHEIRIRDPYPSFLLAFCSEAPGSCRPSGCSL